MLMSRPSQSFFTVDTVALSLRPLTMLLSVLCVTPLMVASRFTLIPRSAQRLSILSLTASLCAWPHRLTIMS